MTERILCVDDEPNILEGYKRNLRKRFKIDIAGSGGEALEKIRSKEEPYAVVVVDMRMPGMDGVKLLTHVKEISPDTVRIMLTGNSDQQTALDAVNTGQIFRFLTKPCPPEDFASALEAGLEQYRLVIAERELLSKTLNGCIKLLTDILSLTNPRAFARASRVRDLAKKIAETLGEEDVWMVEMAAMLSQIAAITVHESVFERLDAGQRLTDAEEKSLASIPQLGKDLLSNIPRLDAVADIIGQQNAPWDATVDQSDGNLRRASILKAALDFDSLTAGGVTHETAIANMKHRHTDYDPVVIDALDQTVGTKQRQILQSIRLTQLTEGMLLADDVRAQNGELLFAKGREITRVMCHRLLNFAENVGIQEPINVFVPVSDTDPDGGHVAGASAAPADLSTIRPHAGVAG